MYLRPSCFFFCFAFLVASALGQSEDTIVKGHVNDYVTKHVLKYPAVLTFVGTDGKSFIISPDKKGDYGITRDLLTEGSVYIVTAEVKGRCLNKTGRFSVANGFPEKPIILNFEMDCGCGPFWPPNIYFEPDAWDLSAIAQIGMDAAVELMNNNPTLIIQIQGHAEASEKRPMKLSEKRAQAAMNYLINAGIEKDRMIAVASGDTAYRKLLYDADVFHKGDILSPEFIAGLTNPDDIKSARALNRWVEFTRFSWDYEPKK